MQNFGRENFDDSTCIRQNSSDFSTVKVLRYTVYKILQGFHTSPLNLHCTGTAVNDKLVESLVLYTHV